MNEPLTLKQLTGVIRAQANSFDFVTTVSLPEELSDGTRNVLAALREAYNRANAFLAQDLRQSEEDEPVPHQGAKTMIDSVKTFRKALNEEDFRTLVSGGVVKFTVRSVGDETHLNHIEMILSDIGFHKMLAIIAGRMKPEDL